MLILTTTIGTIALSSCSNSRVDFGTDERLVIRAYEVLKPENEKNPLKADYAEIQKSLEEAAAKATDAEMKFQIDGRLNEINNNLLSRDDEWASFVAQIHTGTKLYRVVTKDSEYFVLNRKGKAKERFIIAQPISPHVLQ